MKNPDTLLFVAAAANRHTPALQRTFDLARALQAPMHVMLLAFDALVDRSASLVHPEVKRIAQQDLLSQQRAWLDALVERWNADGLRATGEVLWAPSPHEAIVARALELQPALVIKDVGHEPLLRRLTFTALDWRLLRYCPAPLLLVNEHSAHLPRRILAAVDTTPAAPAAAPLNERVMLEAARHSELGGADVHVAHVFPYLPFDTPPYRTLEDVYAMARQSDLDAFEDFARQHQIPPARQHWLEGSPPQRLVELVKAHEIELLVLGSTYRSALDRLFLGSTSEALLDKAACDVLLVKPATFARELKLHLDTRAIARRVAQAADEVSSSGKVAVLRR